MYNLDKMPVSLPQSTPASSRNSSNSTYNATTNSIRLSQSTLANITTIVFWLSTMRSISSVPAWRTQARNSSPTSACKRHQQQNCWVSSDNIASIATAILTAMGTTSCMGY